MSQSAIKPRYYCGECDRFETDPIFLDVETCSKCGDLIQAHEDDELTPEEQSLSEAIGLGIGGRGVAEY